MKKIKELNEKTLLRLCIPKVTKKKKSQKRARALTRVRVIDFVESATPTDDSYPVTGPRGESELPFPTADPSSTISSPPLPHTLLSLSKPRTSFPSLKQQCKLLLPPRTLYPVLLSAFSVLRSGTIQIPPSDFFPNITPSFIPSYQFESVKYPSEYERLPATITTNTASTVTTTVSSSSPYTSPPRSSSASSNESTGEEVRSAFVPIGLNTLPPTTSSVTSSTSTLPEKSNKKPTEGVKNELKAPSSRTCKRLASEKTLSETSLPVPPKPVWRPYWGYE